jgi:hypothetical protein
MAVSRGRPELAACGTRAAPASNAGRRYLRLQSDHGTSPIDAGQVAFGSALTGKASILRTTTAMGRRAPSSLSREGNAAPDTAERELLTPGSPAQRCRPGQCRLSRSADVDLTNDRGVWRGGPGALQLVARAGSRCRHSPGVNFREFVTPVINDGQAPSMAFSMPPGRCMNDRGIWRGAACEFAAYRS